MAELSCSPCQPRIQCSTHFCRVFIRFSVCTGYFFWSHPWLLIDIVQVPLSTVWWWDYFPVIFGNFWSQKALHLQHCILQHFLSHCGRCFLDPRCHCWPGSFWLSVRDPNHYCRGEYRRLVQFQGPRLDDFPLGNGGQSGIDPGTDYKCTHHDVSGLVSTNDHPLSLPAVILIPTETGNGCFISLPW